MANSKPHANLGKYLHPPKGYEDSKYDNDKGVKEGSKEDLARDKKGIARFEAAKEKRPNGERAKREPKPKILSAEERFMKSATPAPIKGWAYNNAPKER